MLRIWGYCWICLCLQIIVRLSVTRAAVKNESTCAVVPGVDELPASLQLSAHAVRIPSVVVVFTRNATYSTRWPQSARNLQQNDD